MYKNKERKVRSEINLSLELCLPVDLTIDLEARPKKEENIGGTDVQKSPFLSSSSLSCNSISKLGKDDLTIPGLWRKP